MKQKHQHFDKAVEFLKTKQEIACSELQIEFEIGYNSGGRLVDELEDAKIIGPFDGSKKRKVLISNPSPSI